MAFQIEDHELDEIMSFQDFYPYMCKTKLHENSEYQKVFEAQREHLEPNNLPKWIAIFKHKETGEIRISHIGISSKLRETRSCDGCGKDGGYQDNYCDECVITDFGDQSEQAKRRGIGVFAPRITPP